MRMISRFNVVVVVVVLIIIFAGNLSQTSWDLLVSLTERKAKEKTKTTATATTRK